MYISKTPTIIKKLPIRDLIWQIPEKQNRIYLTFDDGPHPDISRAVIEILEKHNAKATFFCVGENVEKHSETFNEITRSGHSVGNHTFNHLNGWKTSKNDYLENIRKCDKFFHSPLFRPPYGKIRYSQISEIRKDYKIILWSVLSGDFDPKLSKEKCLTNLMKHSTKGSIIVFHDSVKAEKILLYTLPRFLEYFSEKGYVFTDLGNISTNKQK